MKRKCTGTAVGGGVAKTRESRMCHPCGCHASLRIMTTVGVEKTVNTNLLREDSRKGVKR